MTTFTHHSPSDQLSANYHLYNEKISYTFTPPDLRLLCGQWLTWHRLQQGLASSTIAQQVGLLTSVLNMLEFGRADANTISLAMRQRLGEVLSDSRYNAAWITTVIAAACGQLHQIDALVLCQIRKDLLSSLSVR